MCIYIYRHTHISTYMYISISLYIYIISTKACPEVRRSAYTQSALAHLSWSSLWLSGESGLKCLSVSLCVVPGIARRLPRDTPGGPPRPDPGWPTLPLPPPQVGRPFKTVLLECTSLLKAPGLFKTFIIWLSSLSPGPSHCRVGRLALSSGGRILSSGTCSELLNP